MSKFNPHSSGPDIETNYEGAKSHRQSPEVELYSHVCTSMVQDQFYRSQDQGLRELSKLVERCDAQYIGNLAAYARNVMNLRSVPVALVGLMALHKKAHVRETVPRIVRRADEITELLGFYSIINPNGTKAKPLAKLPKGLKEGLRLVFESGRFDEYQLAKYNRDGAVKLRDALFLSHPRAKTDEMRELHKKLAEDSLTVPYTWETRLSQAGQTGEDKRAVWEELIESGAVGYMALLRNLRNILEADVGERFITMVANRIQGDEVIRAKQFPFRFWSAAQELILATGLDRWKVEPLMRALDNAMVKSITSFPEFGPRVLVACDMSGSMSSCHGKSKIPMMEIGLVMGAVLKAYFPDGVIVGGFGRRWKVFPPGPRTPIKMVQDWSRVDVGHSTEGHLAIDWLTAGRHRVDQVLMFTDMQLWRSLGPSWGRYKAQVAPDAQLWLFDLQGYGQTPIRIGGDVIQVAGWSDRVFEAVDYLRAKGSVVDLVKDYAGGGYVAH